MLVLASQSPRRKALLEAAGIPFRVRVADVDESMVDGEAPEDYVKRLAEAKAMAVSCAADEAVLGADTTVTVGSEVLAKPADIADAERMLRLLSGRKHEVLTGICLRTASDSVVEWCATEVWFSALTDEEIRSYVESNEPMDKAGAYAIQGIASRYIERINGDYSNVVGLPVALVYRHLQRLQML